MTAKTKSARKNTKAKSVPVRGPLPGEDETAYLFRSPANAARLRQAIRDMDAGKGRIVTREELRNL